MADARGIGVALGLGLMLTSGCSPPPRCEETYSPLVKVLIGLPIPMYITMGIAAVVMLGIADVLRRSPRLPRGGLAAVAGTCAVLPVSGLLLPAHTAAMVVALAAWVMLLALVVILSLHRSGPDPKEQSWLLCLSGVLQPSLADRITAGMLAVILVFVTLVGSVFTLMSVSGAGRICGGFDRRPPPAGSAD